MNDRTVQTATNTITFGTIAYASEGSVIWLPASKTNGPSHACYDQVLGFRFDGPDSVVQAVLLIRPLQNTASPSPFAQVNPISLFCAGEDLFLTPCINQLAGLWGFSIMFMTKNQQGSGNGFYFLPDPELAVGSIGTGNK